MDRYCVSAILVAFLALANPGHAAQLVGGASGSALCRVAVPPIPRL